MLFWTAFLFSYLYLIFFVSYFLHFLGPPFQWDVFFLFLGYGVAVALGMLDLWWVLLFYFATLPIPPSWSNGGFLLYPYTLQPWDQEKKAACSLLLTALWAMGWYPASLRFSRCGWLGLLGGTLLCFQGVEGRGGKLCWPPAASTTLPSAVQVFKDQFGSR